jgi:hypothetical protein
MILFIEFCNWAIRKNLDLEDDDNALWFCKFLLFSKFNFTNFTKKFVITTMTVSFMQNCKIFLMKEKSDGIQGSINWN